MAARKVAKKGDFGKGIVEPNWSVLLSDTNERKAAKAHWNCVTAEMADREILSPSNGHAIQRLVIAYLVYDRCARQVAIDGLITEPNPENPKAIARLSIHYKAQCEAEKTVERLEAQLGLSPGRRSRVGKVAKKRERSAGADAFLGPRA
ncbi:P27 family phage terminase small subunit [Stakelama tenebrarum]|uniref:P27 family phage terminase small subunit n=1 Tax=Stakelama tenebrarum TaxID=2711215 RepID=A0A6G6YBC7_9SPHN|nr:P27 family phage terminase small subunit [Sphingosinithalassobacter tenebrarum]QIG81886.1 P27 family phage terminase small subunit [Sphingosinithalassobacter tenebrarum]